MRIKNFPEDNAIAERMSIAVSVVAAIMLISNIFDAGRSFLEVIGAMAAFAAAALFNWNLGKKLQWKVPSIIIPASIMLLMTEPSLINFSEYHIAALLLVAGYFHFCRYRSKFTKFELITDAAALMTAASFLCPPLVWMVAILLIPSYATMENPLKHYVGVVTGAASALLAGASAIYIFGGYQHLSEAASAYSSGILDISFAGFLSGGWTTVKRVICAAAALTAVFKTATYRNSVAIEEATMADNTAIFLIATMILGVLFGGAGGEACLLLSLAFSAQIFIYLAAAQKNHLWLTIMLSVILAACITERISFHLPQMNSLFVLSL